MDKASDWQINVGEIAEVRQDTVMYAPGGAMMTRWRGMSVRVKAVGSASGTFIVENDGYYATVSGTMLIPMAVLRSRGEQ